MSKFLPRQEACQLLSLKSGHTEHNRSRQWRYSAISMPMSQSLTQSLNCCKFKFLSRKNICIHFTGKLTLESSSMIENLKSSNFSDISSLWMGMERKCVNGCLCRAESTSTSTRVLAEITPFFSWPFISGRHSVKQTTLCQHFHLQCWFSLVVDWTRTFLPLS